MVAGLAATPAAEEEEEEEEEEEGAKEEEEKGETLEAGALLDAPAVAVRVLWAVAMTCACAWVDWFNAAGLTRRRIDPLRSEEPFTSTSLAAVAQLTQQVHATTVSVLVQLLP